MAATDQASHLRQLAQRVMPRGRTLAITSGKGGVGKTSLAVNLATLLAAQGRRIVLLDADLGLANADILCNVQPRWNLAHVLAGKCALLDAVTPVPAGFSLVAGASGLARLADLTEAERQRLLREGEALSARADLVIVDTGAGIGRNVLAFAAAADAVALVTTPEPPAMADAYAVLKVLTGSGARGPVSVVVNQARDAAEGAAVTERIARVARQFLQADLAFAGQVPVDPMMGEATRRRQPLVVGFPASPAARGLAAWAREVERTLLASPAPAESYFQRLAGWWRR